MSAGLAILYGVDCANERSPKLSRYIVIWTLFIVQHNTVVSGVDNTLPVRTF